MLNSAMSSALSSGGLSGLSKRALSPHDNISRRRFDDIKDASSRAIEPDFISVARSKADPPSSRYSAVVVAVARAADFDQNIEFFE